MSILGGRPPAGIEAVQPQYREIACRLAQLREQSMSDIERRLSDLNLVLPQPLRIPPGVLLPFPWVNIRGNRALISGHAPQETDGSLAGPFGAVGTNVSFEDARMLARKVALSILTSLKIALGDLDRIEGWCRVFGMVNAAPGFDKPPAVINGFSEVILDVFGPEIGAHARSAVGGRRQCLTLQPGRRG